MVAKSSSDGSGVSDWTTGEGVKSATYEIRDSTPEAVEALLCFVYTGEQPAAELLPPVFELAMQYELEDLAKLIAKRMPEDVAVSNVKNFVHVLKLHSSESKGVQMAFETMLSKIKEDPTYEFIRASI